MKKYLIATQILYLLGVVPWMGIFGLSFLSFDTGVNLWAISIVMMIGLYPIAAIICSIMAWRYRSRRKRAAIIVNLIPMLWIVGIGLPLLIVHFS